MTAKARLFTPPDLLAGKIAEALTLPIITRTLPCSPEQGPIAPRQPDNLTYAYTRVPMATFNENKGTGGITFAAQDKLPKLPIPPLESTCQKYIEALEPLQNPRERAETRHAVREFLKVDGPDLQEKLKRYAHDKTSYIEQFCAARLSTSGFASD